MDRYRTALRETPSGKKQVFEQDLQNTSATMKDVQKLETSIRNIQTSLTSLGGGGLGEQDVLKLIVDNATNLDSNDLNYIASQIDDEFTDSAEVILLINEHVPLIVDSDYVNARVDAAVADALDSAEALKLIEDTVDSDYVNARVDAAVADALDSSEALQLIDTRVPEIVDSAYVNNLVDVTALTDDDYDEIAARVGDDFLDSAEALQLITQTVDSAYVNARIDENIADNIDSAAVVGVITETVDSAYVNARIDESIADVTLTPLKFRR